MGGGRGRSGGREGEEKGGRGGGEGRDGLLLEHMH